MSTPANEQHTTSGRHTPAPWLREGGLIYALIHAGWRNGVEQFKNWFTVRVEGFGDISADELEANTRLMQAAPELLEVLKVVSGDNWITVPLAEQITWLTRAKAVIASVEGITE